MTQAPRVAVASVAVVVGLARSHAPSVPATGTHWMPAAPPPAPVDDECKDRRTTHSLPGVTAEQVDFPWGR